MRTPEATRTTYDGTTPPRLEGGAISVVMLSVLWHPDLARVGDCASLPALLDGREVLLSRDAPALGKPGGARGLPLGDACVSRTPLRFGGLAGGGVRIDATSTRTKVVYKSASLEGSVDIPPHELERGVVLRLGGRIVLLLHRAVVSDLPGGDDLGIVGDNPAIHRVRREIRQIAPKDVPVLVRGETGTGKELVARAIHRASARRDAPFVAVNLAAVSPGLAAAELFGAERGSFTGSVRPQPGYFRMAEGGTLFLDEIGEAPAEVQTLLLRALQTGEVQTVGQQKSYASQVRIVAATDADLDAKIADGGFRAPLLHRLASSEIALPPLRERRDDIGRLLLAFLRRELAAAGAAHRLASPVPSGAEWLPASLVSRIAELDWPGNVRQLENVARQIVIGAAEAERVEVGPSLERLLEQAAGPRMRTGPTAVPRPSDAGSGVPEPLSSRSGPEPRSRRSTEIARDELLAALRAARWDIAAAAQRLGIPRTSMYALMERSPRIRTASDLTPDEIARSYQASGGDVGQMVAELEVSEKALRRRLREMKLGNA